MWSELTSILPSGLGVLNRPPSFLKVLHRRVGDLLPVAGRLVISCRHSGTVGSSCNETKIPPVRFAVDVTACWRPQRVGMTTVAIELSKALVAQRGKDEFVLLCSRERPRELVDLDCEAVLSPYRHEVDLKMRWLPAIEPKLESDAILYPYWPSPPFRRQG